MEKRLKRKERERERENESLGKKTSCAWEKKYHS